MHTHAQDKLKFGVRSDNTTVDDIDDLYHSIVTTNIHTHTQQGEY